MVIMRTLGGIVSIAENRIPEVGTLGAAPTLVDVNWTVDSTDAAGSAS
jgi:hypothetical protein